ncbi:hypothetical protein EV182_001686, partial [Spiromyces aspiralis]
CYMLAIFKPTPALAHIPPPTPHLAKIPHISYIILAMTLNVIYMHGEPLRINVSTSWSGFGNIWETIPLTDFPNNRRTIELLTNLCKDIMPIIRSYGSQVKTVDEKGKVISLRLRRFDNPKLFLEYGTILGVFLHE